ncbi:hypothetical protein, variant [Saprolegnia diclina VS20]|nr:hypothetical protein, variant [Saprolegnia diclina VS20]EQC28135.1 hypothetical protein, variant [Saprolegnia diclina VS20]|eukprot:XP_008618420.1 hypothetical protein, variant [Saprolegnia diclina VS20]
MTKRQYRVQQLLEFFPKNANLLGMNVNHGWKIYVRLRPAERPTSFLPFEHLLGTMLHELVHMKIGPHNAAFYKLLDELTSEMESLMAQGLIGITGAQFQNAGQGHALGGANARNVAKAAADAAIQRMRHQALVGANGSCRLGGDASATAASLTPAMLRQKALKAAERRRHDQLTCGTHDEPSRQIGEAAPEPYDGWSCDQCTFLNDERQSVCAMCGAGTKKRKRSMGAVVNLAASPPRPPRQPPGAPTVIDLT